MLVACRAETTAENERLAGSAFYLVKLPEQKQSASLLLGSSHTSPKDMVFPKHFVERYAKNADHIYHEGQYPKASETVNFLLPSGQSLYDVTPRQYHLAIRELISAINEFKIDDGFNLEHMHPGLFAIYWNWLLPTKGQTKAASGNDQGHDVDSFLSQLAIKYGVSLRYLEPTDAKLRALTSHPLNESLVCLYGFIRVLSDKELRDHIRSQPPAKLIAFNEGDIEAAFKESELMYTEVLGCPASVFQREFSLRNKQMVQTIVAALNRGETAVFAPGFAHLGGPYGIVKALQDSGVQVTRLTHATR